MLERSNSTSSPRRQDNMNLQRLFATIIVSFTSLAALSNEGIIIQPLDLKPSKLLSKAKKKESISLIGTLQTVPMSGAKLTIQSDNYGRVILFSPMELDLKDSKSLEALEANKTTVRVTGTMLTMCSERDLKADVMGCRWMDTTKLITIEKR